MKRLFFLVLLALLCCETYAQVPQAFCYQAVARDANDSCLSNQIISIRISIRDTASNGPVMYQERHDNVLTNEQGLFSVDIGTGIPQGTASFSAIDWPNGSKWMEVEMDPAGASNFIMVGSQQLLSVPFALVAENRPSFNSGWFSMSSQAGTNSYQEVAHNLGFYPSRVTVQVRAIDGPNAGFIFEGMGAAQSDDDGDPSSEYGGLIYAYNQQAVRLWAPDQNNALQTGRIIFVGDGWGGEVNGQASQTAEVRVLVWR